MITAGNTKPTAVTEWSLSLRVFTVSVPSEQRANEDCIGVGVGAQPKVFKLIASEKTGDTQ